MLNLEKLKNKKIGILGLGIENYALINFLLAKKVECEITICDFRAKESLADRFKKLSTIKNIKWRLGASFTDDLSDFDILMRSPGWPLKCPAIIAAKKKKKDELFVYSPMKLFFDLCPTKNIIGVTGTKGKGTTSSLVYEVIKASKRRVFLGGNIGIAPFDFILKIKKGDWVVLELSSFQLEDMYKSPRIAVFTNFSREHLASADPNNGNFHSSMNSYWRAKSNIFIHQKRGDKLVVNEKLEAKLKSVNFNGDLVIYKKSKTKSFLVGEHNKENIAAMEAVAKILRIKREVVLATLKKFKGLEHRIELVREDKQVKYYDDSFATTPDSAIIALKSFNLPIILLAGGADKGSDFDVFAREVKKRVKFLILFEGLGSDRIRESLVRMGYDYEKIKTVSDMASAIKIARQKSLPGDIVLLSPACASFGVFKNYKERGEYFKREVKKI